MKALMLYVVFVVLGVGVAAAIAYYIDRQTSSAISQIVFLALFFINFVVSWIITIFVMDGSLDNAWGEREQVEAERRGRESISNRG
jgi:hypothetical protein